MALLGFVIDFFTSINGIFYLIAYLFGGIPFGLIYGKIFGKINITEHGSGSIGATNVLRVLKETKPEIAKKIAILTIISDALKGIIIIAIARYLGLTYEAQWFIALLAVLGHCYSPFLRFEGGKGVATGVGVIAMFLPLEALIGLVTWFIVGKILKISSIASLFGVLIGVSSSFIIHPEVPYIETHTPLVIIAFIIFYKHIPNIVRLIQKKESKII
ncbi:MULTISPECIES: glycerol-3-phosphate 1-O-acyltransferase PlsY [Helicobacter]|uniref:Glycerol-3-phosphate acyltransferase n=1 Tax=Helicobacter ibis TaxID=2962633 RepID=A0ABT4VEU9_9HELI|nr:MULTISPECIES: glycerol-3-phosphate 1-O-acyltransferase PlsY [Helicobacter]MDA3967105.1 glycerol-3-phosphate 1-O-acyltransferase PlsY [Helicobacter sp. WB40]MDA3969232.1 glycerol-3-phosphate 1-O-acyltransferase PlsY [Helicobacter ibis]